MSQPLTALAVGLGSFTVTCFALRIKGHPQTVSGLAFCCNRLRGITMSQYGRRKRAAATLYVVLSLLFGYFSACFAISWYTANCTAGVKS